MQAAADNIISMALIYFFIFILFSAGIIVLQIFLSKAQSKWLGLVLPGISLIISIFAVMGRVVYTNVTTQTVKTVSENGDVVNEIINHVQNSNNIDLVSVIFSSIIIFIICNIPTAILLAIYCLP